MQTSEALEEYESHQSINQNCLSTLLPKQKQKLFNSSLKSYKIFFAKSIFKITHNVNHNMNNSTNINDILKISLCALLDKELISRPIITIF